MNGDIKRYIYIIGTVCIVFLVGAVVLHILPWLLLAGFIAYVVMKIVGAVRKKKEKKDKNNFDINSGYDNKDIYQMPTDDYNGEIIDVEYEDVGSKKD